MNKIQILLFYYERPKYILNALRSIKQQDYDNWELHFIDDGSEKYPGEEIVKSFFTSDELKKIVFYNTKDTKQQKILRGGSIFGQFANLAMNKSDADITFMLCDDDAVHQNYLKNLNNFYMLNSHVNYAYSHVIVFDPSYENYELVPCRYHQLNAFNGPINPRASVDASQVSWRRKIIIEKNILFPYPQTFDLDASLYQQMYEKLGPCVFTHFFSQYKAFHSNQLGNKRGHEIAAYDSLEK